MSVCLESSSSSVVLPAQVVGKLTPDTNKNDDGTSTNVAKPGVAGGGGAVPASAISKTNVLGVDLQTKVNANSSVITVVNTPITVVKSIGGTGGGGATPFALNPSVTNPSTITLVSASPSKGEPTNNGGLPVAPVNDKQQSTIHNVFVKKSTPAEGGGISVPDMPQSHKLLTANPFPPTNILQKLSPITKTQNGQRGGKVKILGHQIVPSEKQLPSQSNNANPGPSNVLLNKNQRFFQQKVVGNGATKYLTKPMLETGATKRVLFHGKTGPNAMGVLQQSAAGTNHRPVAGIKTIPPQRSMAGQNKPNYIGKHAVQAQKIKPKLKPKVAAQPHTTVTPMVIKSPVRPVPDQSAQTIFNQALTAQILETLSDKDGAKPHLSNSYGMKYEPCLPKPEPAPVPPMQMDMQEAKRRPLSTLDTLSFVCQAVLLDHNYNATLPSEPPPKPLVPVPTTPPTNGAQHPHPNQQFSPIPNYPANIPNPKRNRTASQSAGATTPVAVVVHPREDDAASDISEHKEESEGEETDTAPEAETVANEGNDRYGDYVTRCICGFIHDDGFMIECDKCKVWQHVRCVVKTKKVPEDYFCEECEARPVDRQKARVLQQQWMREIQERDAKLRKEQLALSDSDSTDTEAQNKNRRKEPPRRQRRDSLNNRAKPGKRKERKVPNKRVKAKPPAKSDDEKLPQIRQWIENYEEAMTNHYSPDLRSRISSARLNGAHSEIPGGVDLTVNKCRVQTNPTSNNVRFLVASVSLPMGTPVIELRGKYMLSTQHRSTTRQQRPGPFLFFHTLIKDTEVCVDTRTYGNCARFVRRSCTPNAKLQHVFEKGILHLFIVTTKSVEKGSELTIRHESHDLAAAQLTEVPCACVNPEYCALIKGHRRHNGDIQSPVQEPKKRRGRQSREAPTSPATQTAVATTAIIKTEQEKPSEIDVKDKILKAEVEIKKEEPSETITSATLPEIKDIEEEIQEPKKEIPEEPIKSEPLSPEKEEVIEEEPAKEPQSHPRQARQISTRRASRHSQEQSETGATNHDNEKKPMSREERKMAAIVKAIERLEKQELRRQEHQAKQAHRREPDATKEEGGPKSKRRKRKGRARTTSTTSTRRNRLDSADSVHSSDDTLLSPPSEAASPSKAAGMLLALANGELRKSPDRQDSSNSAHSSPETPLSAACLMVAAAVEPLEPGFKFPKTKKVLMNEWLNKSDVVQPASAISPSSLTPNLDANALFAAAASSSPAKCLNALAQAATFCDQPRSGSAKKRWLRQAISEDQCDSPPQADAVAPPKKRKLPRESLSCESSPPSTPTANTPSQVEIVTHQDEDGTPPIESDASLSELVSEMQQEFGSCVQLPRREEVTASPPIPEEPTLETRVVSLVTTPSIDTTSVTPTVSLTPIVNVTTTTPSRAIMDPRLAPRISTSELVGTVEKTLSFLGYEEKKHSEALTPAKRKLSITEYRQRKKLNNNDKSASNADDVASITEESNSSQSPKMQRTRSNSVSSVTSGSTSEDEQILSQSTPVNAKAVSAFNSEPTELERQRESNIARFKLALGVPFTEQPKNIVLDVDTILKNELPTPPKTSLSLSSPIFPIPGRDESMTSNVSLEKVSEDPNSQSPPQLEPEVDYNTSQTSSKINKATISASMDEETQDGGSEDHPLEERKVLYYTPDDEEVAEGSTYVPPFNNPLYPNTSYTYGSVIDDDAPYEGRNPSPPPNLRANPS